MADVPIYVAVIAAAGPIIAGAIPLLVTRVSDGRRAERDRRDRIEAARQQACVELLQKAGEVRTFVADYHDQGGGKRVGLAEVRQAAQEAKLAAVKVRLAAGPGLGESAARLAEAVAGIVAAAEQATSLEVHATIEGPDFGEFDKCFDDFTSRAVGECA